MEHALPKAHGGVRPLPHMVVDATVPHKPPGLEFQLPNTHRPAKVGPARAIVQQNTRAIGHYSFEGVVAHDQSRIDPMAWGVPSGPPLGFAGYQVGDVRRLKTKE